MVVLVAAALGACKKSECEPGFYLGRDDNCYATEGRPWYWQEMRENFCSYDVLGLRKDDLLDDAYYQDWPAERVVAALKFLDGECK